MPAAKPMTKISRTRAKAKETSLPRDDLVLVIKLLVAVRRRGLLEDSPPGWLLDNSDIVIVVPSMFRRWREEMLTADDVSQCGSDSQPPYGGRQAAGRGGRFNCRCRPFGSASALVTVRA
jgi:hypothetical protein